MAKAKKEKQKITETTGFWIFVVTVIVLILIGLSFYWAKIFLDKNYYNYQGKGGEYKIGKSKVGNVIFYYISVFVNDHEYIYSFRNHPKDLEDIYLEPDLDKKLNRSSGLGTLYVTKDPELQNMTSGYSVLAIVAFEQIMTGKFAIYNVNVSNADTSFVTNSTIVATCNNVTSDTAVVYMKLGNETRIYSDNDCIIIQGRGSDGILRAGEKFAYYLLGVF